MLWVRGRFWIGEVLLIINLFNLIMLYFRHSTYPRLIHIPIVSAPLAWTYIAILWDGAAAVNAHSLAARIVANVFIWGILGIGAFYVLIFKDYTMGFELAILSLGECPTAIVLMQRLTMYSPGSWPILYACHRCSMGVRPHYHGHPSHFDSPCFCTRSAWRRKKCQTSTARRR